MKRFILAREASLDLFQISDYLLQENVEVGERFIAAFDKKRQHLARFPHLGKPYAHINEELRGVLLMEDYTIFYQLIDNGIEILHIA